jgi:hypothetical protein
MEVTAYKIGFQDSPTETEEIMKNLNCDRWKPRQIRTENSSRYIELGGFFE